MAAFASVWSGLGCVILAVVMVVWRSMFNDWTVPLILWLGSPGTICIAGMVLWSYRKDSSFDPGITAQRVQCKVAIGLAITAAAIVYALIFNAEEVPPGLL